MRISGQEFGRAGIPHIVGVVNLSPESPNKDSLADSTQAALARAARLVQAGASIIDIGAQSSYFAAPLLSAEEEIARLLPALLACKQAGYLVSVDTFRAEVASAAIKAGADVINDSDGFQDPAMIEVLAGWKGPVILPFISGPTPHDPVPFDFSDPVPDIRSFLQAAVARAERAGIKHLILDPGTGYRYPGVSAEEKEAYQVKVYAELSQLCALGHPIIVALPRKEDRRRTLELVRLIVECAEFVRAHEPEIVREALSQS